MGGSLLLALQRRARYAASLYWGSHGNSDISLLAHPGPHPAPDAGLLATRSTKAKRCANEVGMMKRKRHVQRKRDLAAKRDTTDYTIHAQAPHYDFLTNDTCLLFPETTQGPYYFPRSEILRQDMREGQPGIETELDISLIDVNTCEPLEGALISLWVSYTSTTDSYFWTDRDLKALQRHWIL